MKEIKINEEVYCLKSDIPALPTFRDKLLCDYCMIWGVCKIDPEQKELVFSSEDGLKYDLVTEEKLSFLQDLKKDGSIRIFKDKEEWTRIGKEFFKKGKQLIKLLKNEDKPRVILGSSKSSPILMISHDTCVVIAPRQPEADEKESQNCDI